MKSWPPPECTRETGTREVILLLLIYYLYIYNASYNSTTNLKQGDLLHI